MPLIFTAIFIHLLHKRTGAAATTIILLHRKSQLNEAVALIATEKHQEAIMPLQSAEKSAQNDADIQNLLGFVHRKTGKLDVASSYYQRALEINPKHKGALEYQGELFLMLGDKDAAEANLAKLDKICWLGCSEYDDLKKAVANSQ